MDEAIVQFQVDRPTAVLDPYSWEVLDENQPTKYGKSDDSAIGVRCVSYLVDRNCFPNDP
jgi:hypothetical protein